MEPSLVPQTMFLRPTGTPSTFPENSFKRTKRRHGARRRRGS